MDHLWYNQELEGLCSQSKRNEVTLNDTVRRVVYVGTNSRKFVLKNADVNARHASQKSCSETESSQKQRNVQRKVFHFSGYS